MTLAILEPIMGTAVAATIGTPVPANTKRKFTKFNAYNTTAAPVPIKIYLVPAANQPTAATVYVDYTLAVSETYNCPEIIGAALNAGGSVYVLGAGVAFSGVASDTINN